MKKAPLTAAVLCCCGIVVASPATPAAPAPEQPVPQTSATPRLMPLSALQETVEQLEKAWDMKLCQISALSESEEWWLLLIDSKGTYWNARIGADGQASERPSLQMKKPKFMEDRDTLAEAYPSRPDIPWGMVRELETTNGGTLSQLRWNSKSGWHIEEVLPFKEEPEYGGTIPQGLHGWRLQRVLEDGNGSPFNQLYAVKEYSRVPLHESSRPVLVVRTLGDYWICQDRGCAHGPKSVFVVRMSSQDRRPSVVFHSQGKGLYSPWVDVFKDAVLENGTLIIEWGREPVADEPALPREPQMLKARVQ